MPVDPWAIDSLSFTGLEARNADAMFVMNDGNALGSRSGVRPGDPGLTVTLAGSTINVSVGVAAVAYPGQGVYRVAFPSVTSPGSLTAAHATLDRIDLVYVRVWDNSVDASGLNKGDIVYLAGTPSSTPAAPAPAGTQIYMPLATITVPHTGAGSPSVSTAVRPTTVAPGGILPSTATPSSPYLGQYYDNGTDLLRYNGSGWDTYQKVLNTSWTQPTLATGFTHDGNSNGNVQYRLVTIQGTNFVEWRGGIGITYASNAIQNSGNFLASALGVSFRPPSTRSMTGACSASSSSSLSLKIDFKTDGTTSIVGTTTSTSDTYANPIIRPPWVSLNGIRYAVS
ncbi:hypothetical protein ACFWIO_19035 [Streptomyces diastatochromogenes]|uniref:hypothetical protein n=1 Tax=Streptomyces diastatochromogenes TaxID=42236 RepID=UPI003658750A